MSEGTVDPAGAAGDVTHVTHYPDESEADTAAGALREAGITPIVTKELEPISQRDIWSVSVAADEATRAAEVLGLPPPGASAAGLEPEADGVAPADDPSTEADVAATSGATEGTSRLGRYLAEDEANAVARRLLEAGVTPVVERELEPGSQREVWWVAVFAHDLRRASELLGVVLPDGAVGDGAGTVGPDQPLTRSQTRWRVPREKLWRYIAAYVVLVIVVGILAFYVAFKAFERDADDLQPPPTLGPVITSEAPG